MGTTTPQPDTRLAQAERVADFLELHPDSTLKEIDAACDAGSISKVISDMRRMGYGVRKGGRSVPCDRGNHIRRVCTYALMHRPTTQPDLFRIA